MAHTVSSSGDTPHYRGKKVAYQQVRLKEPLNRARTHQLFQG